MSILAFIGRRLAAMVVLLALLSLLCFGLLGLSPGSPEQLLLGTRPSTPELRATIRAEFHLDEPFLMQYWHWLTDAVRFDFGVSAHTQQEVTAIIGERFHVTALLAVYGLVVALLVAIPAGLYAGVKQGKPGDQVITFGALLAISAPAFALSVLLLYVFGVALNWFPVFGAGEGLAENIYHLTLPAIALAAGSAALMIRQLRASVLDVTNQDFMTFARARGLSPARIWTVYLLRNSCLPMLTISGLVLAGSLAGAVIIEQSFGLAGLGSQLITSVQQLDIPVVQALALLTGATVIIVNLLVDLAYIVIDPRVRHPRSAA
ncbi:ABC transporter permease [Sinosporangium siamense]|uniref:ABC transporter permease n=1 Tax=Sinosporangium siamense TaxID=1367973 RepID=A0A919RLI8_9ACTN|nr:ABC transporter permease [Sinosporangium siamense]GII95412.1 ABC transporter permease [Sinosporangium siamense]